MTRTAPVSEMTRTAQLQQLGRERPVAQDRRLGSRGYMVLRRDCAKPRTHCLGAKAVHEGLQASNLLTVRLVSRLRCQHALLALI
jgi:hypothetical protein